MLGRPRTTLVVVGLVSALLLPAALRVRVDSAVDRLLPLGDPASAHLERMRTIFGSDEIVVVALFADDVFRPTTLARLTALTEALERLDDVEAATSLANLEHVRVGPDGLGRERLLPPPPWTADTLRGVRRDALAHPLARAGIVAGDARATGIVVHLAPMTDEQLVSGDLAGRLQAIVAEHPGPERIAVTGLPILKVRAAEAMVQDVLTFFVLGVVAIATVLGLAFRTLRGALLPLAAVLGGLGWTAASMTLAGDAYTLGTLVLSPLLLSVGIAYAIHLLARYEHERAHDGRPGRPGRPSRPGQPEAIVRRALSHVVVPIVMAALTTLVGFAAFLHNPIPTIRDFGWYAGVGLVCVAVATLTVVPSALTLLPADAPDARQARSRWIERFTTACTRLALGHRRAVLGVGLGIAVVAALGVGRIQIETDYLRFFAPRHPARADNARVAGALVGTQLVVLSLEGTGPESLTSLPALEALHDLVAFLGGQRGVDRVVSYLDHLDMVRRAVEPDRADEPLGDQRAVDQRLLLLNPESMRRLLTADRSKAQVIVHTTLSGSREVQELVARVEAHAARRMPASIETRATGTLVLLTASADTLATEQVAGLSRVMAVLVVLLIALFRSLTLGLLSLVPNLFPVLTLFGIMGWTGIDLNVSTSMIACIAIGIAVDDTIHYLTTYEAMRRGTSDAAEAVADTVRTVGRPIVVTSIALAAGFLVPCFSSFQPVRHFGMLASVTMALALFADLLLLPALLVARGPSPREQDA